jgi:hypothetical protein
MRVLPLAAVLALAAVAARPAEACVQAGETNKLLGWSADGAYALSVLVDDKGKLDHAEIHPTTFAGFVYVIVADDDATGILVLRSKVGQCASFGHDELASTVERKKGALTEASLRALKTVAAMKFGRDEVAADNKGAPLPAAAFTGKKRYETHDFEISAGATRTVMPIPVWCAGSCLADENWNKWRATVVAVHTLASGLVLYETSLANVCNGGTLVRLIAPTPAAVKVPKHRCTGSGDE